jgi:hypothetical protein
MGCQTAQAQLFYDFCLDDHVPADHLLRGPTDTSNSTAYGPS